MVLRNELNDYKRQGKKERFQFVLQNQENHSNPWFHHNDFSNEEILKQETTENSQVRLITLAQKVE